MTLDILARHIQQRSRLCFSGHKRSHLRQRVEERVARLGMADHTAYLDLLESSPREESQLLELLTINETSFFRNPGQFRYLMARIIPELETARGEQVVRSWGSKKPVPPGSIMKLRILCAGCSTGEEPYSVAMALHEALRYPRAWQIEILACDLSEGCIRTAATGYYENDRLAGLPAAYLDKYMERTGDGARVRDEIKRLVRFSCLNLGDILSGDGFPGVNGNTGLFDIIFCRNVMIYFSAECQQQLVDTLFRLLVPGGYLFTGDAEPLHMYAHDFKTVREAGCLIYQKMEAKPYVEAI